LELTKRHLQDCQRIAALICELLDADACALAEYETASNAYRCAYASQRSPTGWSLGELTPPQRPDDRGNPALREEGHLHEAQIPIEPSPDTPFLVVLWRHEPAPLTAAQRERVHQLVEPLITARAALQRSEQDTRSSALLESILQTLVDGVITMRADGTMLSANDAVESLLGYTREQLIGSHVSMLMPEPHAAAHDAYVRRYLETQQPRIIGRGREVLAQCASGSCIPIQLSVSEVKDRGEIYFTGILSDLRSRKLAESKLRDALSELEASQAQLIHAEKMTALGRTVAGVAHELNNPIMSIGTFAQYCAKRTDDGDARLPILHDIEREAARCARIVRGLLDFSHTGASLSGQESPQDLAQIVSRVCNLFSYQMRREEVTLDLMVDPDLPLVCISADGIEQVVVNLVSNALDSLRSVEDRDPKLTIALRSDGAQMELTVSDNGGGIDPTTENRIFDPFFTTKPVGSGTGLGLSISQGIVRAHGGTLTGNSLADFGARFRVTLPLGHSSPSGEPR